MATYTVFIVTRNARHHYPVIMANNGKAILNEPVKRRETLNKAAQQLLNGWKAGDTEIVLIHESMFKAKFPKYAPNKGPKKKPAPAKRITKKVTNPVK